VKEGSERMNRGYTGRGAGREDTGIVKYQGVMKVNRCGECSMHNKLLPRREVKPEVLDGWERIELSERPTSHILLNPPRAELDETGLRGRVSWNEGYSMPGDKV